MDRPDVPPEHQRLGTGQAYCPHYIIILLPCPRAMQSKCIASTGIAVHGVVRYSGNTEELRYWGSRVRVPL